MAARILTLASVLFLFGACGDDDPAADAAVGGGIDAARSTDADVTPDAPTSCLEQNGWPISTQPGDYQGEGYDVGDLMSLPGTLIDQNGNGVAINQFYGAMLLIHMGAVWVPPSNDMDMTREAREASLNGGEFVYREITVLVDDGTPGGEDMGGYALEADAATWATNYSLTGPVLAGEQAWQMGLAVGVAAFPTILILDPTFEIVRKLEGYPGDSMLEDDVTAAWNTFKAANPSYVFDYCTE